MLNSPWFPEFLTIVVIHGLAVASPGPDFAVVTQTAIRSGRRIAMITALGVGTAILWHVGLSLAGVSLLFQQVPALLTLFTLLAALYLGYLGVSAMLAKPAADTLSQNGEQVMQRSAFVKGLMTNGLNPKATLFFIALFAVVISPERDVGIKLFYGIYMALATAAWFCLLAWLIGSPRFRSTLQRKGYWLERITGVALVVLAIKLVIDLVITN
ncbi:LysE family translocator [Corallincola holothuriorum]|uniref:LysE family translocator n=1 Tax=Corallincola holothuriorum TaxID=2282215 RepID=A0A368NRX6_9GAMM|nr:LysE family transporter [Corallincola holothuriorum]RCU52693.1 LysE family translocator [Corallincola holothuriorum]